MISYDEDEYIDPRFERPMGGGEGAVADEQAAIALVRRVVTDSVAEMGRRRRRWYDEYLSLYANPMLAADAGHSWSVSRWLKGLRLKTLKRIFADLPPRRGVVTRDVHRKTHGCLAGQLCIASDIRPDLAVGLFQPGATYDAVIRLSNGDPQAQKDDAADARAWPSSSYRSDRYQPARPA